jgi:hypothetical protein
VTVPSDNIHPLRSGGSTLVRRIRSALTGVLIALAAVAPAASVAAEPDSSQEGGGTPEQVLDPDSDSPSFDPGGETDLPFDTGPPSGSPEDSPDAAPLESEPADDPEGRAAPFAEPQTPVPGSQEDPPAPPVGEPAVPAPGPSIEPQPSTPPPPPPAAAAPPQALAAEPGSRAKSRRQTWTVVASVARVESAPAEITADSDPMDAPANAEADPDPTSTPAVNHKTASRRATTTDGRIHIVRPGESLWTIAQSLLGPDASQMTVAAEVARLWELNRTQIPSGDPDLIAVGQRLRLR